MRYTCCRFGYVVFNTPEVMERMLKDKQGEELDGEKIFLDYTNEKSGHKGGKDRSRNREFGRFVVYVT